jgi:hypothetical protein
LDESCLADVASMESHSAPHTTPLLSRALGDAAVPYLARVYVSSSAIKASSSRSCLEHVQSLAAALRAAGAAVSVVPVVALADDAVVHCAVHFSEPLELSELASDD